jgi:hypothetical protein
MARKAGDRQRPSSLLLQAPANARRRTLASCSLARSNGNGSNWTKEKTNRQPDPSSLATSPSSPPHGRHPREQERRERHGSPEEPTVARVTRAGVRRTSVEREPALALRMRHLAQVRALVPEVLVPRAGLIRLERSSALDENAVATSVALVVEFAVKGKKNNEKGRREGRADATYHSKSSSVHEQCFSIL